MGVRHVGERPNYSLRQDGAVRHHVKVVLVLRLLFALGLLDLGPMEGPFREGLVQFLRVGQWRGLPNSYA